MSRGVMNLGNLIFDRHFIRGCVNGEFTENLGVPIFSHKPYLKLHLPVAEIYVSREYSTNNTNFKTFVNCSNPSPPTLHIKVSVYMSQVIGIKPTYTRRIL